MIVESLFDGKYKVVKENGKELILTLDEVMKIQQEGREKRKNAEAELVKIEAEMRDKIIEVSRKS